MSSRTILSTVGLRTNFASTRPIRTRARVPSLCLSRINCCCTVTASHDWPMTTREFRYTTSCRLFVQSHFAPVFSQASSCLITTSGRTSKTSWPTPSSCRNPSSLSTMAPLVRDAKLTTLVIEGTKTMLPTLESAETFLLEKAVATVRIYRLSLWSA